MTDHAHVEARLGLKAGRFAGGFNSAAGEKDRLIDHPSFRTNLGPQLTQPLFLEKNDTIRPVQRCLSFTTLGKVLVEIRTRQRDDNWSTGGGFAKPRDRVVAAPSVQRDQDVARLAVELLRNFHPVPRRSKQAGPA